MSSLLSVNLVQIELVLYVIANGNSLLTLIVLSAQPVISRVPVASKVEQKTPASASRDPGCGMSSRFWNAVPLFQSHKVTVPLSPRANKYM